MNRLFGAAKRSTVFIANVFMFASIAGALVGCATPTTKILPPSASLPSKEIVVVHDQSQQITINENTSLYNGHTFSLNEYDGRWYSPGVPDSYTRIYQDSSGKWVFEGRLAIPDQQLAKKLQELQDQVQAARARNNFNTVYNNFFQQLGEIRVAVSDVFSRGEMLDKMEDIKAKLNELQDQVTNLQSTVEQQAAAAADVAEANEQAAKARDEKARVEADARAGKAEAAAVDRAKKAEAAANARESRAEASRAALEAENRISFKTISELILGLSVLVGFGILANSFRQNRLRRQVSGLTARVVFLQNAQNQSLAAQARLQASLQRARTRVTRVVGGIVRRQDAAGERELIDLNAKLAVKNAELERMFRIAVRDMSVAEEDQSVSRIDALARAIAAAHYDVPYNDEMFNNPTDAVRTNLRRLRQHISDEARAGASLSGRDFLLRQLEENTSVGIEIDSLRRQLNSPHFAQGVTRARALAKARARDAVGGINLSDEHLTINIKVDGAGLPMAAKFQDKAMVNLDGITPKIRAITLLTPAEIPELFQLQK